MSQDRSQKNEGQILALSSVMNVVASMGGIAGSQTLILVIRGLALGQASKNNRLWLVSLLNGIAGLFSLLGLATLFLL